MEYRDSPLSAAIEQLGGVSKAANKLYVSRQAIYLWRRVGYVTRRDMAIRLARLSGVSAEALMALPTNGDKERARGAA